MRAAKGPHVTVGRYETFVIRLWIEDEGKVEHGEIRHVGSSAGERFREIARALTFIRRVLTPGERDAG